METLEMLSNVYGESTISRSQIVVKHFHKSLKIRSSRRRRSRKSIDRKWSRLCQCIDWFLLHGTAPAHRSQLGKGFYTLSSNFWILLREYAAVVLFDNSMEVGLHVAKEYEHPSRHFCSSSDDSYADIGFLRTVYNTCCSMTGVRVTRAPPSIMAITSL
ncbi:hypothetical protein TNCV_1636891 [Trichonephila clavipes]|nr:hypothetical protein TNCV_1636891 [Trichonephila clavipes]